MAAWSVYLIRCNDNSLYTGIATDVDRRFAEHQQPNGKCAKYLRGRGPLTLELQRPIGERSLALKVESRIKKLPKNAKEAMLLNHEKLTQLLQQIAG